MYIQHTAVAIMIKFKKKRRRKEEEEVKKTAINNYLTDLNNKLELDTFCKSTGEDTRRSSRNFGDLGVIKNIILRME